MRLLNDEQPPLDIDSKLSQWLISLIDSINASLQQTHDYDVIYDMPKHEFVGMVRYFGAAVLPNITAEGLWVRTSTGWIQL